VTAGAGIGWPDKATLLWSFLARRSAGLDGGSNKVTGRLATYGEVADFLTSRLGKQYGPQLVSNALFPMHLYCWSKGIPPLNEIVVREDTGLAGTGIPNPIYACYNEVLGFDVTSHEAVWKFPFDRMGPDENEVRRLASAAFRHGVELSRWRRVDLQIHLARGQTRLEEDELAAAEAEAWKVLPIRLKNRALLHPPEGLPYPPQKPEAIHD
jgi:hypothetical protein